MNPTPQRETPNGALALGIHLEERIAGALLFRPDLHEQLRRVRPEHFERPELCAIASAVAVERLTDPDAIAERIVLGGSHGAAEAKRLLVDLADWATGAHGFNVKDAVDEMLDRAHAREAAAAMTSASEDIRRRRLTPAEALDQVAAVAERQRAEAAGMDTRARSAVLRVMADVRAEPVRWLWPGRIALGKLTMIAGDPGLGKSFLTLDLAARVSIGAGWPDAPHERGEPGGAVLLSAEDDIADTIRPRLDAAGADVSRIIALQAVRHGDGAARMFSLVTDLAALDDAIAQCAGCRLVVADPITAYLGKTDSHKNADIRGLLAPLAELAARHGVAIVAVSHLNKSGAGPAMYRTMGSLAFVAAARAAWAVARDPDDHARRLLLPVKNNLAPDAGGLAYTLRTAGPGGTPYLLWDSRPVTVSADDVLAAQIGGDDDRTEREDAAEWLRTALADGPVPADEVKRQAKANAISEATLRRAKSAVGVVARKLGFGDGGQWLWALPDEDAHPPTPGDVSALGEGERLRVFDSASGVQDTPEDVHAHEGAHPSDVSALGEGGAA